MANTNSQDKAGVSRNAAKCWLQQYEKSQIRVNTAAVRARPCLVQDSYQSLVWDSSLSSVLKGISKNTMADKRLSILFGTVYKLIISRLSTSQQKSPIHTVLHVMAEILLDHNSGKSASAIWGKGTVQIWDSPKCTHQIAETAFPSIVVPPIRLISIVGQKCRIPLFQIYFRIFFFLSDFF